jgi:tetratricopeptide (TPR) repeat protein
VGAYRKVCEQEPSNVTAQSELGDLLRKTGDRAGAVEAYGRAAALDAGAYPVRIARAELLSELSRKEEALAANQEACQVKPEALPCWQALAALAAPLGKLEIQVGALERVIQIEPGNLEAQRFLAPYYLKQGEIEKAQPSFQALVRADKDNVVALAGLAATYEQGEEFSKAIEYTERVLKLDPAHPEALQAQQRLFKRFHIVATPISGKTPDQVFGKNRVEIEAVYKARLKEVPQLRGDLLIKVRVTNQGNVEEADLAKDTVGDQILQLCAVWNLRRSKFPVGIGATYEFELGLKPGG